MGRVAALLSFTRVLRGTTKANDVKADRGGGDTRTLDHFSCPGDDSFPLPSDFMATVDQGGTGRESVVGYIDPANEQKATAGDKRIYARDAATGAQVVEVWLKSDGSATTENANGSAMLGTDGSSTLTTPLGSFTLAADGSVTGTNANGNFTLQAGGDFVVNGVTIDISGNISTEGTLNANDVTADNLDVTLSTHQTTSFGTAPTPGT